MYAGISRMTSKGQITVPVEIRKNEKLEEGSDVLFVNMNGVTIIKKASELKEMFEVFEKKAKELNLTSEKIQKETENEKALTWKKKYAKGND